MNITIKKIQEEKDRLREIATDKFLDTHNFSIFENLSQEDGYKFEFLDWCLAESNYNPIYEEVKESLGFGYSDDMNYYGEETKRNREPLTEKEEKKLLNAIEKKKKEILKELLK